MINKNLLETYYEIDKAVEKIRKELHTADITDIKKRENLGNILKDIFVMQEKLAKHILNDVEELEIHYSNKDMYFLVVWPTEENGLEEREVILDTYSEDYTDYLEVYIGWLKRNNLF